VRRPRKRARKRGERSTNPHGVKRERIGKAADATDEESAPVAD
jgi:hypothetical protein